MVEVAGVVPDVHEDGQSRDVVAEAVDVVAVDVVTVVVVVEAAGGVVEAVDVVEAEVSHHV